MEFQPTHRAYTTVDPFKPSISYSIGQIQSSHKAPRDDTNLHSPPPQAAIHPRKHTGALQPSTGAAVGRRFEAPPGPCIPTAPSDIGLPAPHRIRMPNFEPPTDNQNLLPLDPDFSRASDPPIRLPPPHEFPDRNLDFQSRRHSRSPSPSNRWTHVPPTSPFNLRSPSPVRNFDFRPRHHHPRSPSSSERNGERSRSPRRRHSRSRSRTPIQVRGRSTRRSTSRSDDRPPPAMAPSPLSEPELPVPPSVASSIVTIRPGPWRSRSGSRNSTSGRSRSRTPPIIPYHSPELISLEPPQSRWPSGSPAPYPSVIPETYETR